MSTETIELQEVMQGYFPWHKARVRFIAAFIVSLIKLTSVNFTKLANALNGNVKQKSNYRRIQRFFAHFDLSYCSLHAVKYVPIRSGAMEWTLGGTRSITGILIF